MQISKADVDFLTNAIYRIFDALVTDYLVVGKDGLLDRYKRGEDLAAVVTDLIGEPTKEEVEDFRRIVDVFKNYETNEEV